MQDDFFGEYTVGCSGVADESDDGLIWRAMDDDRDRGGKSSWCHVADGV